MKKISDFSKGERIFVVISVIWLILIFVFALSESRGKFDDEFMGIFLIVGVLPVFAVAGWKWIKGANKADVSVVEKAQAEVLNSEKLLSTLIDHSVNGIKDSRRIKSIKTNNGQGESALKQDKVIVDLLYGAVYKNASDFYEYIKSKGYYHSSGAIALILRPDVYAWFVGYAALYMLCLKSEKLRSKPAQISLVRELVLGEATKLSMKSWENLEASILHDAGKTPKSDESTVAKQISPKQREIFEGHTKSVEEACRECTRLSTNERKSSLYLPIYKVIGPAFGGSKDLDEAQLEERFGAIFGDLMNKTSNVLEAL